MTARSRLRIGFSWDRAITSRIADSETARIDCSGSARLNRYLAGSLMFQTTWKSMSTMFSSPVSIRPWSPRLALAPFAVPTSIVFSRVTGRMS